MAANLRRRLVTHREKPQNLWMGVITAKGTEPVNKENFPKVLRQPARSESILLLCLGDVLSRRYEASSQALSRLQLFWFPELHSFEWHRLDLHVKLDLPSGLLFPKLEETIHP